MKQDLEGKSSEPPTTYIWTMYFLVQHYSSIPSTIPHALSLVDEAIAHTPTLPELYMAKARALKRARDPLGASATMGAAWRLDLQDRFLNTKYAKYLLRAGFIEEGNKTLGLFTKVCEFSYGTDNG
jgi:N-alpha-acetyltransferase 15/16, NatA auxiliary subunit